MMTISNKSEESKELSHKDSNIEKDVIKYIMLVIFLVALWPSVIFIERTLIETNDSSSDIFWTFIWRSIYYILLCSSLYYWFKIVFNIRRKIKRKHFVYFLFFVFFFAVNFLFAVVTIIGILITTLRLS